MGAARRRDPSDSSPALTCRAKYPRQTVLGKPLFVARTRRKCRHRSAEFWPELVLAAFERIEDPDELQALAQAVQALAPKLDVAGSTHLLRVAQSGLGAAGNGEEGLVWANVVQSLVPGSVEERVGAIITILKYPTAALRTNNDEDGQDDPTAFLLRSLGDGSADAAVLAGGDPMAAAAWVSKRYPGIDLTSPPERPPSLVDAVAPAVLAPGGG